MKNCEEYVVERLEHLESVNDGLLETIECYRNELEEMRAVENRRKAEMVKLLKMFDTEPFGSIGDKQEKISLFEFDSGNFDEDWMFLVSLFDKYGVDRGGVNESEEVRSDGCACSKSKTENN